MRALTTAILAASASVMAIAAPVASPVWAKDPLTQTVQRPMASAPYWDASLPVEQRVGDMRALPRRVRQGVEGGIRPRAALFDHAADLGDLAVAVAMERGGGAAAAARTRDRRAFLDLDEAVRRDLWPSLERACDLAEPIRLARQATLESLDRDAALAVPGVTEVVISGDAGDYDGDSIGYIG